MSLALVTTLVWLLDEVGCKVLMDSETNSAIRQFGKFRVKINQDKILNGTLNPRRTNHISSGFKTLTVFKCFCGFLKGY